jgi:simple sugar transport system permease protein
MQVSAPGRGTMGRTGKQPNVTGAVAEQAPPRRGVLGRVLLRPEFTAVVGTIVVFAFFAIDAGDKGFLSLTGTRNYLEVAAEVGIVTVPVCLLLIAGEFDLSIGAMIGAGGILFAYPVVEYGWPLWLGVVFALSAAAGIGFVNGVLVVKTGIPSFLVTLASMFVLSGTTLAVTNSLTGATSVSGVQEVVGDGWMTSLFNGHIGGFSVSIVWWLALTAIAAYVLDAMRAGNWIYASGGNVDAAYKTGVPVHRVKIMLFMCTSMAATLVAILATFAIDSADVSRGTGKEFQAATAAVIGGTLIAGGSGSPIGAAVGALLFGMVSQGFFFTSIDDNWFQAFLGLMLLMAVVVNQYTRSAGMRTRRKAA